MSGVVHVGANLGQEIPSYIHEHRTPVLAFEPLPEVFNQALELYMLEVKTEELRLCNVALGDTTGTIDLFVAQNADGSWDTPTASAYGGVLPEAARKMGWQGWLNPYNHKYVTVPCFRFEDWASTEFDHSFYDSTLYSDLIIDVQGMEFPVLKGFGRYLNNFKNLVVECSEVPIYEGGAPASEVCQWLINRGFLQVSPIRPHADISFTRMG